ncbi:SWIM zinc finger domain-containing protein [uncultured Jatrophihabitans sp.]|uniref:SWIM zinc finger family protein n=1 Tax=uncultured Jatrophihabitans sp. TaxID=1610747 RepID=UPI0035C98639
MQYAIVGRVSKVSTTSEGATATVQGSADYQVELWCDDDEAGYVCSCPMGGEDRFCKHAVAVALVATDAVVADEAPSADPSKEVDLATYLRGLDHDALVDLLEERAAADDLFEGRLRMAAARTTVGTPSLAAFRHALAAAFETDGFISYREAYDYTSGIDSVLDSLGQLLEDGHADAVVQLAEHAAELAEEALAYIDDSDGGMSGVAEHIRELHLAACVASRPDPVALARNLYDRERHEGDLEIFYGAVGTYADVLGDEGLAEYRRLAQQEWDELPPLGPEDERSWSSGRFRLTQIMLTLAELSGDVDAEVAVLAHDQSSAYQFVKIAETLQNAQRHEDALEWALKGLSLHGFGDQRLVELVADEHHRVGRPEQAVNVLWSAYEGSPGVDTYQRLAEHARRAGLWQDRHDQALALLRERIASKSRDRYGPDNSTLVAVLLLDGNPGQAWIEAQARGCRRDQWLELARLREAEHPEDALPIWREEVDREIGAMNNQSYASAVATIERVGRLMSAAGRGEQFAPYVAGVRDAHRRKRNLMKLFAERGW